MPKYRSKSSQNISYSKIKGRPKIRKEEDGFIKEELIKIVPDIDDPSMINFWITKDNKKVYVEGWSDACLLGTGFPTMEKGGYQEKINYIKDLTPKILRKKAKEENIHLVEGGFIETINANNLYGITYGIYEEI